MTTCYLINDWENNGVTQIESDNPDGLDNAYPSFQDAQKAILTLIREQESKLEKPVRYWLNNQD